jgi:phosphonoacetaldehyde hydrolase
VGEARESMGLAKKEHIRAILAIFRVREAWTAVHSTLPNESAVDKLYTDFLPRQIEVLVKY